MIRLKCAFSIWFSNSNLKSAQLLTGGLGSHMYIKQSPIVQNVLAQDWQGSHLLPSLDLLGQNKAINWLSFVLPCPGRLQRRRRALTLKWVPADASTSRGSTLQREASRTTHLRSVGARAPLHEQPPEAVRPRPRWFCCVKRVPPTVGHSPWARRCSFIASARPTLWLHITHLGPLRFTRVPFVSLGPAALLQWRCAFLGCTCHITLKLNTFLFQYLTE